MMDICDNEWCVDCGQQMRLNGHKTVSFMDLANINDNKTNDIAHKFDVNVSINVDFNLDDLDNLNLHQKTSVKIHQKIQRYECKNCKIVAYDPFPKLKSGFRLTSNLYKSIALSCLSKNFTNVAKQFNLDSKTIANVWKTWVSTTIKHKFPDLSLLESTKIGQQQIIVVRDCSDGSISAVFDSVNSKQAQNWFKLYNNGHIITDLKNANYLQTIKSEQLKITIDRFSVLTFINNFMPRILSKSLKWFESDEKKLLKEVWPTIIQDKNIRLPEQDERLFLVKSKNIKIAQISFCIDKLKNVFETNDPSKAFEKYKIWNTNLNAITKDIFSSVIRTISNVEKTLFIPGYELSPLYDSLVRKTPDLIHYDSRDSSQRLVEKIMLTAMIENNQPSNQSKNKQNKFDKTQKQDNLSRKVETINRKVKQALVPDNLSKDQSAFYFKNNIKEIEFNDFDLIDYSNKPRF